MEIAGIGELTKGQKASEARIYLLKYAWYKGIIIQNRHSIMREKDTLKSLESISSVRAIDYAGTKVQTTPEDQMSESVIRLVDGEKEIREEVERLRAEIVECNHKCAHIEEQIKQMRNSVYSHILFQRYIEGTPLKFIAQGMNYNYHVIIHKHRTALEKFYDIYIKKC